MAKRCMFRCVPVLLLALVPAGLLSACAGTIMRQGQANAGDLPAGFLSLIHISEPTRH